MFFNAPYWTGKKTCWEFIDSYLLPATCLHQDLCAGAQFRSFSVPVASKRGPDLFKRWWPTQRFMMVLPVNCRWPFLYDWFASDMETVFFLALRALTAAVVFHWVLGVFLVSVAFPDGSWWMEEIRKKPADVVNILGGGFKYFYFHPYLGKIPILTKKFQMGWNHQVASYCE